MSCKYWDMRIGNHLSLCNFTMLWLCHKRQLYRNS